MLFNENKCNVKDSGEKYITSSSLSWGDNKRESIVVDEPKYGMYYYVTEESGEEAAQGWNRGDPATGREHGCTLPVVKKTYFYNL